MIRVLVVASSPIARAGLEAVLREGARFVVLTAPAVGSSVMSIHDAKPDVLLMEVASADKLHGHPAFVRDDGPPTLLLADHLGRAELRRALHSGVRAILPRNATGPEIAAAIEGVAAGLAVLSSEDLDMLLPSGAEPVDAHFIPDEALTSREIEVLGMMSEGLGNKEIGSRLQISEHTVKFHVSSILGKLHVTTRGGAVARGVREGLIVI